MTNAYEEFFKPNNKKTNKKTDSRPDPDWMHKLPGYQDEVAIHEELAKKYANENEDEGEV